MEKITLKSGLKDLEELEYYENLGAILCPHVGTVPLSELDYIGPDHAVECRACQLKNPVYEGEDVSLRWKDRELVIRTDYEPIDPSDLAEDF